jgi:hypothetical protein
MLRKVRRIKLGKQIYRRLMKGVLGRDSWRCRKCGSLENLQVHHKIKRSQQGNDSLENLVTLCAHCHMAEHGQLFYSVPAVRVCCKPKPRRNEGPRSNRNQGETPTPKATSSGGASNKGSMETIPKGLRSPLDGRTLEIVRHRSRWTRNSLVRGLWQCTL